MQGIFFLWEKTAEGEENAVRMAFPVRYGIYP